MIYLANSTGFYKRLQIFKMNSRWGALNIDGTQEIVPFTHKNCYNVINVLKHQYGDLKPSSRLVDSSPLHIICLNKTYLILDDNGINTRTIGKNPISFKERGSKELVERVLTTYPEHYINISQHRKSDFFNKHIKNDTSFVLAQDIDTLAWVCMLPNNDIIGHSNYSKEEAIDMAILNL